MTTVSSSDYLSVKKRSALLDLYPEATSNYYTANKQYLTIQTTAVINEYDEPERAQRFSQNLPYNDLSVVYPKSLRRYRYQPMFVIPRISVEPYIKNKYIKPICWNCPLDICQICTFCNLCSYCDIERDCDHECDACNQTRFFYKTGMFFMEKE